MDWSRKRNYEGNVGANKRQAYPGTPARTYFPNRSSLANGMVLAMRRRQTTAGLYSGRNLRSAEKKVCDFPVAGPATGTLNTTAYVVALNTIQVGSSFYNRIGNEIEMKSLHFIANIFVTGNITTTQEYCRILLIYDRQPIGTASTFPTFADFLTNYDNAGGTTSTSVCSLNPNNKDRFMILRDIRFASPNGSAATGTNNAVAATLDYTTNRVNINEFVKLKGLKSRFKASTNPGNVGDISTGALYLFAVGNKASGAEGFQFNWEARLSFYD